MSADDRSARRRRRASAVGRTGARFPVVDDVEEPAAEPLAPAAPPESADPPEVADASESEDAVPTGARFGSPTRRQRRHAERAARETAAQDAVVSPQAPPARHPGAVDAPAPVDDEVDDAPTGELAWVEIDEESSRIRVGPYVRTRGRTRVRTALAVETLVSLPVPRPTMRDPEHAAVERVCDRPRSVAEVAALVEVPLGVARVLIDDMAAEGLLNVHRTVGHDGAPPAALMRRVLEGLHRL